MDAFFYTEEQREKAKKENKKDMRGIEQNKITGKSVLSIWQKLPKNTRAYVRNNSGHISYIIDKEFKVNYNNVSNVCQRYKHNMQGFYKMTSKIMGA